MLEKAANVSGRYLLDLYEYDIWATAKPHLQKICCCRHPTPFHINLTH